MKTLILQKENGTHTRTLQSDKVTASELFKDFNEILPLYLQKHFEKYNFLRKACENLAYNSETELIYI